LPLPTLDLSLGYTRTHNYEGGDEISQSDQVNGNVTAEIYPDLTVGLSPSWTRNRSLDTGAKTTNYGFTLTSSVRLNPRMNLTANLNYFNSTTDSANTEDQAGSTKSRQYGATLSYRPSDVLLVSSSLQRDEESDNTSLSGNLAWLFTRSVQANAGASYSLSDSNSEQYNASVHWSISRNLSLQGTGGYQVADSGNSWNLGTSLNANY
jgi:outer membrane scaffolding protein for murein synthesis (MipA/OmpV family)